MKKINFLAAILAFAGTVFCCFGEENQKNVKAKWWESAVCYEIYVRSFNDSNGDGVGDLNGITEKLDYLSNLGVDVIWITPFYPSPGVDMGYDISDYKNVDPLFGTIDDFKNLVKKAHEKNIKILCDMVFSHTSDQHKWFKAAKESKDNEYRDYYYWATPPEGKKYPNDWQSWFSGPAWEYNKATKDFYLHIFAVQQPALNWENPKVRKSMESVAKFWLDLGADGLRFDVITLISLPKLNQSSDLWGKMPKVHTYLKDLNKNVLSKYDILTVGEMPGVNYENAWEYVGTNQKQLETVFQLDIMGLGNKNGDKFQPAPYDLVKFKEIYQNWYDNLYGKGWNSVVMANHDQARTVSRWGNDKEYRVQSAKLFATFLLTQWGIPYIYQGDEIGMTNCPFTPAEFKDIEEINYYKMKLAEGKTEAQILPGILARCRDNARTPMQWSDSNNAGFTTADKTWLKVNPNYKTINVATAEKSSDSILNYYKQMIQLKKSIPALIYGTYAPVAKENKHVFAYYRALDQDKYFVVLNFSGDKQSFQTNNKQLSEAETVIFNYENKPAVESTGTISLRPYEAVVYKLANK